MVQLLNRPQTFPFRTYWQGAAPTVLAHNRLYLLSLSYYTTRTVRTLVRRKSSFHPVPKTQESENDCTRPAPAPVCVL